MDNDEKKEELDITPEEQIAEEEISKEVSDDELRSKLAEDLGVDPDVEEDLLNKLVEREKANRERLSGAIKQKINWRQKAQGTSPKPNEENSEGKSQLSGTPSDIDSLVERKLAEARDKEALESLNTTDELKEEISDLAKLKGISIREAAQLPYIRTRMEDVEKEERIKAATPKRSSRGSYSSTIDPSKPLNPEDFDFNSEEGIKAWNDAKAARAKYRA